MSWKVARQPASSIVPLWKLPSGMPRRSASARAGSRFQSSSRNPEMQAVPPRPTAFSESKIVRGPTSSNRPSTWTRAPTSPSSSDDVIGAGGLERGALALLARRGEDLQAAVLGDGDGRHADRRRAAADEQRLARLEAEQVERAPCRPEALGDRAQLRPIERRLDRDDVRGGQQRVLGVAAVEISPHPAHGGDDRLTRFHDLPHAFDAEDTGELHGVAGLPGPRAQLGAVEPERPHAHQDPARARLGGRDLLDAQHVRTAGLVDDGGSHQRIASPSSARAMTSFWISLVPS